MGRQCKYFSECHSAAVYKIPYSGLSLCKSHFLQYIEKRVKKTIDKYHIFHPERGHKLLVAASGGKDSQVLLHILRKLYPDTDQIEALYIELGIRSHKYSQDSAKIAKDFCEKLNIPFHQINIRDDYGITIDDVAWLRKVYKDHHWPLGNDHFRGICAYCGAFKRYSINRFAYENGFTTVVTGHNLTDEATSLSVNFFNGNLKFLSRKGLLTDSNHPKLVTRAKPLFYVSEEEVMMYSFYADIPHLPTECPYSIESPNIQIKTVLNELEETRKGMMLSLVRGYYKKLQPIFSKALDRNNKTDQSCQICGMPTYSRKCSFCRMMDNFSNRFRFAEKKLNIKKVEYPKLQKIKGYNKKTE